MKKSKLVFLLSVIVAGFCLLSFPTTSCAQTKEDLEHQINDLKNRIKDYRFDFDRTQKLADDAMWFNRMGDIAIIDKVNITGPPKTKQQTPNPTAQDAGNPLEFPSYIFIPKDYNPDKKYPLMVFAHGGVHSNLDTYYVHIMRELMAQGYIVVAPEYRGSAGYDEDLYKAIDYGGREVDDMFAARNYMIENYSIVDKDRIGIMGWSHGGMQALMNIFRYPKAYKVAYAGVPVSDLVARMGYKTQSYRHLYSTDYHIGKTAYQDVKDYERRSPAYNADKLETPLLIHTNTSDAIVNVLEVKNLINALKAAGKDDLFDYKIYQDAPGGHHFNRIDTKLAKESRLSIYKFLANYLHPEQPMTSMEQMMQQSYQLKQ